MPRGEPRKYYVGTLDRETGLIIDYGYARANEVKSLLGIANQKVWLRTLDSRGIAIVERATSGRRMGWLTLDDARRLLSGGSRSPP